MTDCTCTTRHAHCYRLSCRCVGHATEMSTVQTVGGPKNTPTKAIVSLLTKPAMEGMKKRAHFYAYGV